MTNTILKKLTPHLLAHLAFIFILSIYYAPVFSGKKLMQNDVVQSAGFLKESIDYTKKSNEEILWTNSMFSGMPSWRGYTTNIVRYYHILTTTTIPVTPLLSYIAFLGFYVLLWSMGANFWLSFIGSAAFAFSSFNIVSIEAGHAMKVFDMALMAPVLAGILLVYNKKYWLGAAITTLFLSIHIFYAHYQITYYLIILIGFLGVYELIKNIREKTIPHFIKGSLILIVSAVIAVGPNISQIWTTQVYSKNTQRAGSELSTDAEKSEKGLDKDYTFNWSNGITETMTGFIPYFYGGSSNEELGQSSNVYKALVDNQVPKSDAKAFLKNIPLYWGDQPFTSGPVYFGAGILFLFVLSMLLLKDNLKWWVLGVTVFAFMLSWGKNFDTFNDFFFYNFPLYNKFRSVTMVLCIPQVTLPFLAILVLVKISNHEITYPDFMKGLKWATISCAGVALFFAVLGSAFFDFTSINDADMAKQYPEWLMEAIRSDRAGKLQSDSFRSLFFVLAIAGLLWAFVKEKIKPTAFYIVLSLLVLIDLVQVDFRYLNYKTFRPSKDWDKEIFALTETDEQILQDKDTYYRVANFTKNPFADATTSYYHKSIGGYSAIKLARYQDLIDNQLSKNNIAVYSMLNTKYFIVADQKTNQTFVQRNPNAAGNAWFVEKFEIVKNADAEMKALDSINPKATAFVDAKFEENLKGLVLEKDSASTITLTEYHPNRLTYKSNTSSEQLAVFSDIYYQPGWNAYIDGQLAPHFRADYVLRAMRIPKGEHKIEFKFEPAHYFLTEKISMAGSILFVLFIAGCFGYTFYTSKKQL